jgi:hypothetical protein
MFEFETDQQPYADIPVYGSNTPDIDWSNVKLPSNTSYGSPLDMLYAATNQGGDVSAPGIMSTISNLLGKAPGALGTGIQQLLGQGSSNLPSYLTNNAGNLTALLGLYSMMGGNKPTPAGYAGSIPKLTASREQIAQPAGRRPGSEAGPSFGQVRYAAEGGYLRGASGGMSDELETTIDDSQPAKLSHGEFVVPADVVSHLGDGNSEAGAKKLYEMMDRVRHARTGKKEQAPQINSDKLMPKFNGGGIVAFEVGGQVPKAGATGAPVNPLAAPTQYGQVGTSSVGTLAPWAGEYVTGMLGKAQALSEMPYAPYTAALTPGASGLQQQAFQGLSALTTPAGLGAAEQRTAQIGQQLGNMSYAPTTFGAEKFTPQAAQEYMNPYLQAALNPQLEEARRQAEIQRVQQAGRLTKAGAYGGSRQAIMESELARNLGQSLANITGQGYNTAYQQAASQFDADQRRKAAAEAATEASRQYGAGYGMSALDKALAATQQQAGLAQAGQTSGLKNIEAQLGAGATQRDIESQGLAADYKRFQEERDWPYKMLQYQQSFLQGLPISATSYAAETSPLQNIIGTGSGLLSIYQALAGLGQAPTTPKA